MALFLTGGSDSLCVALGCYGWLCVTQVIPVFRTTGKLFWSGATFTVRDFDIRK